VGRPKLDESEKKRKTHVNLARADRAFLDDLAAENGTSLSGVLGLIVAYLKRRRPRLR
jgi:hypothetical protein